MQALPSGCPGLISLNLSVTAISDIRVQGLANGCPGLTSLDLRCCNQISDIRVQALATAATDLHKLELSDCNKIIDVKVQATCDADEDRHWRPHSHRRSKQQGAPETRHEGQSLHEDGANYSNPGEATLNQEKFDADSPYLQVLARSSPGDKLTLARSLMFQIRRGAAS